MATIVRVSESYPRTETSALRGYLVSCGVTPVDAMLIEAILELHQLDGLDSDGLAGALLRSVSRCRREAYREGYEDASELLAGTRQSPLVVPALWEE